jgi:hypothetical protein
MRKTRYLMTSSTMNQARAATTTLPTNTSGKKRLQLSFDHGASVGRPSDQMAAWEGLLLCRLFAASDLESTLVPKPDGGSSEAMKRYFHRWCLDFKSRRNANFVVE